MVGNKAKGSRSKPKAVKAGPAEPQPQPSQTTPSGSVDVASDGEERENDILDGTEISFEEEKILYGSITSDGLKDNDLEKDVATDVKADRTEDVGRGVETVDDVKELSDGGHETTNLSVEDNQERGNADNQVEGEASLKFDYNDHDTGGEREVTLENGSANSEALASDHGLGENVTDNLENDKEPSKLNTDEPIGALSDKEEAENIRENATIDSEVKVATSKVNRPKRKVIKKKLLKKKLVSQPTDVNNASEQACDVDANEHVNFEEKALDVINASEEACKADNMEHVSKEKEAEVKPSVTVNKKRDRIRKKKALQKTQNDELESERHIAINEADVKNDEVKKSEVKVSPTSPLKGSSKKKEVKKLKKGKSSKKVDSMGMIFMCSSETKKDCFRFNVLGLPASKKDMVVKIYKGMRLFLFDVDLRMMYGIYKAAGPGGYNIEPRAFKSQFPSQVRFTVLEDCVPLAEERFRKVLKDNYYSKKKFNFQLNHEQVKNLCKLFHETSRKAESTKRASRSQRAAPTSSTPRSDKKRKRVDGTRRVAVTKPSERERSRGMTHKHPRHDPMPPFERERSPRRTHRDIRYDPLPPLERQRSPRRTHEESRLGALIIADRYLERPTYGRETYVPSMTRVPIYQPLPPPRSPPRSTHYSYDTGSGVDPYRMEMLIDSRDLAPSRELRVPLERTHHDSYLSYREPAQVYNGPAHSSATRRELYDYGTSDRRYATESEYSRTANYDPLAPSLPLYRRY